MAITGASFNFAAAADYMVNGGIVVPEFQSEITDLVRRAGVFAQRIEYVPATGAPSRFFEQNDIVEGAWGNTGTFNGNGGNGQSTNAINPTAIDMGSQRIEKSVTLKAITSQINYSLFDMETIGQQANVFAQLKAKDLKDMVNGMIRLRDKALWTGQDKVSGNTVGGGSTGAALLQFVGVLNQVQKTAVIASGASIIDGLRTQVATLMNDIAHLVVPTAIYINPMAADKLEQEARNSNAAVKFIQTDISDGKVGVRVTGLVTAAGVLPIVVDPFLTMNASVGATAVAAAPTNQNNYPFAIVCEDLVEMHYVKEASPRVFEIAMQNNLNEQYVGILFQAPVVKAAAYAHVVGVIQF